MARFADRMGGCCRCGGVRLRCYQFGSRRVELDVQGEKEFDHEFDALRAVSLLLTIITLGSWDGALLSERMCVWVDRHASVVIDDDDDEGGHPGE